GGGGRGGGGEGGGRVRARGRPADRRAGGDGARRGDDVPLDAVAADQRVHRAAAAGAGDRRVGGQRRRRDRAGPDRRRLAAGTVLVGQHLLVLCPGGRGGRAAGRPAGAHEPGPAHPPAGLARAGAVG